MRWEDPEWLRTAIAWVDANLPAGRTGDVEQPHVRSWSTVLRVPTADGDLWFKATIPIHRFEVALARQLARTMPDRVSQVVAADPDRGWLLMRDAGTRLREVAPGREQLADWERLLPLYAELQLAMAPKAEELLALGVPDERLAGLTSRFQHILATPRALHLGRAEGLSEDELARLRAAVPDVAALCDRLAAYGIPETLQHDDLHDGQVFVRDGRGRVLDWGDSCISHPFHTLVVTLRALAYRQGIEPGARELTRLRDAYLEPFGGLGSRDDLVAAADLAYRTGTIARAHAWFRYVSDRDPEFESEEAEGVAFGLRIFLAGGPIGSWDPDAAPSPVDPSQRAARRRSEAPPAI
jgi:phosphotransferase family enzyme